MLYYIIASDNRPYFIKRKLSQSCTVVLAKKNMSCQSLKINISLYRDSNRPPAERGVQLVPSQSYDRRPVSMDFQPYLLFFCRSFTLKACLAGNADQKVHAILQYFPVLCSTQARASKSNFHTSKIIQPVPFTYSKIYASGHNYSGSLNSANVSDIATTQQYKGYNKAICNLSQIIKSKKRLKHAD